MVQRRHETAGFLLDDLHGGRQLLVAQGPIPLAGRLQVVDRVEVDFRPLAHGLLEVARHGQIEHEQRALGSGGLDLLELLEGHDRLVGAGGADDQVGLGQGIKQFLPRQGLSVPLRGQFLGTLEAAVDHGDLLSPFVPQIAERFLGHLAGTDHQRLFVVEPLEDLAGEVGHGHTGDAHAPLLDGRLGRHTPGNLDGRLERGMGQRARVVALVGQFISFLDLGQDLRLADDHTVETAGHGEQMQNGLFVRMVIELVVHLVGIQPVELGQEGSHLLAGGGRGVLGGCIDFDPIARGKQHGLDLGEHATPPIERLGGLIRAESQLLPQGDPRTVMTAPDDLHVHAEPPGGGNSGKWLVVSG